MGPALAKSLVLTWAVACIGVFVLFPGRVTYVQWSNLGEIPGVFAKLAQINYGVYLYQLARALVGVTLFSLSCLSFGMFILGSFNLQSLPVPKTLLLGLAILATQFLIGQAVYSLIFLTIAGVARITPALISIALVAGFLLGGPQLMEAFARPLVIPRLQDPREKILLWVPITILLTGLLLSAARISYDASAIYFSDARATALTGHVFFFTADTFVASVFQSAIQYSVLIQLFGDQSARLFSWICSIAIIALSLNMAQTLGVARRGKLLLLVMFVTSTAFLDLVGDGKVDLVSTLPAIAAVHWMIVGNRAKSTPPARVLFLIGLLAGFAIVARPFNAYLLGVFTMLFYTRQSIGLDGLHPRAIQNLWSSLVWVGLGAALPGLYHLFANWMILGDPLGFLTSAEKINPASGPWDNDPHQMILLRLFFPVAATMRNTPQSLGNVTPLILALAPAFLVREFRGAARIGKEMMEVFLIAAITLVLWLLTVFTVVEIRYVFFLWILIFIPIAELIANLTQAADRFFAAASLGLIIFLLAFCTVRTLFIAVDSYSPVDDRGNPQCTDFIPCDALASINLMAAPGDRVLGLSAYRYYLRSDLFACTTTHDEYDILQRLSYESHRSFWEEVYREGYAFIAYENDYTLRHLQFGSIPDPLTVPEWMSLVPIYGNPGDLVIAYRIDATNPPFEIQESCASSRPGAWEIETLK